MDKRIAVEEGLDSVGHYLKQNGYQVVPLQGEVRAGEVDCLVISGGDKNMMGMADIQTGAPVINAQGRSAEEVYREVQKRVPLH